MKQKESTEVTNQEVLPDSKNNKSTAIINAVLIGFLIGIVIYSVVRNSVGFFTLIPLFFAYKIFNKTK